MLEAHLYNLAAIVLPAILLVTYVVSALLPRILGRSWSEILPAWIILIVNDVVSEEDIRDLEQEEQGERERRKGQLTPQQRISQSSPATAHNLGSSGSFPSLEPSQYGTEVSSLLAKKSEHSSHPTSSRQRQLATNASLAVLALVHIVGWIAALTYEVEARVNRERPTLIRLASVQILVWLYALVRPLSLRGITVPYDLFVLYLVQTLAIFLGLHLAWSSDGKRFFHLFVHLAGLIQLASLVLSLLALGMIVSMPLSDPHEDQSFDALGRASAAEDECTLWQWMTFSWVSPLIGLAVQRTLEKSDVWQLSKGCRSSLLFKKFKKVRASTLPWRILKANGHDILLDFLLTILSSFLSYASPFFLKRILEAIEASASPHPAPNATPKSTAYLFALLALIAAVLKSQADLQHLFYGRRATIRIRGQLISSIYEKALRTRDMTGVLSEQMERSGKAESKTIVNGGPSASTPPHSDSDAASDASVGRIVSLAAVDAIRIAAQCAGAYMLYSAPIEFIIASLFLYKLLGLSAFAGYLVLLIASPLQSALTRRMIRISKSLSMARDKRLSALNELISNLKFVKYYAFEAEMRRRVLDLREIELAWLHKRQINSAIIMALWTLTPAGVTTVSFACYVLIAKQNLDVPTAFTSIALFGLLRAPLNTLPVQINELLNAKVSADRIEEFFNADEVPESVLCLDGREPMTPPASATYQIGCENATFGWPVAPVSVFQRASGADDERKPKSNSSLKKVMSRVFKRPIDAREDESIATQTLLGHGPDDSLGSSACPSIHTHATASFQLTDITFIPPPGKLCLVIGQTGSGKSALLTALLGEMTLLKGTTHLRKSEQINPSTGFSSTIAYCAQTPWLQHASIRSNILFGAPFELTRYNAVLDCCALRPDLEILGGDYTEIGEKGVSLSGGQQARVALARAVYSRAQTVLLDDPLSAVDAHTASQLVKACLSGPLMKGRTVVLVTHHSELVLGEKLAHSVVKLSEGRIIAHGTPQELQASGELEASMYQIEANSVVDNGIDEGPIKDSMSSDREVEYEAGPRKLIHEEHRAKGGVKKEVYKLYLDGVGWLLAGLVILTLIAYKGTDLAEKGWLAVWGASSSAQDRGIGGALDSSVRFNLSHDYVYTAQMFTTPLLLLHPEIVDARTAHGVGSSVSSYFPPAYESPLPYIFVFFGIQLLAAATIIASALLTYYGSLRASRSLFARMLDTTMGATARWLDTTPTGRIVNKFSRDVEVLDSNISNSLRYFINFVIIGVISVTTVVFVLPSFFIPTIVLGAANWYVARGYIRAARDLRRLESVSRSPIFSAFSELLQGISTVRAFGGERRMLRECTERIDLANSFFLYFWMTNRWLLFRLDILGAIAVFVATCGALRGSIAAGVAGLALTQAQGVIQACYWIARFATNLEQDASSIERIQDALENTPQEPREGTVKIPSDWPKSGLVEVSNLTLRYAPDLPQVLKGVSFTVRAGEKVGIVGRTGSGKSTTALAFFRFVEFDEGSIHIDGVDISSLNLHDLRSKITIIPQNSVLFSGTIRSNLDPFHERTDDECISALHAVNIRTTPAPSEQASRAASLKDGAQGNRPSARLESMPSGGNTADEEPCTVSESQTYVNLDTRVSEQGGNFSQGQRQLFAMARALLRRSQIILMDEASSAVDFSTDDLIQSTIRSGFAEATVITIAHRLRTVVHADKVLVLDAGKVREFDSPRRLLENPNSIFTAMCQKSGDFDALSAAAAQAEQDRKQKISRGSETSRS